jgi:hypothetical protein
MWRRVAYIRTDVPEERFIANIFRVMIISELETTLTVTSNSIKLRRIDRNLILVTAVKTSNLIWRLSMLYIQG